MVGTKYLGRLLALPLHPDHTSSGLLRRDRSHLTEMPDTPEPNEEQTPQDLPPPSLPQPEQETQTKPEAPRSPIATRSRTGTAIKPPLRYRREYVMRLDVT